MSDRYIENPSFEDVQAAARRAALVLGLAAGGTEQRDRFGRRRRQAGSLREPFGSLLWKLGAAESLALDPYAPLGTCEIDGSALRYILRKDHSLDVCCTAEPQHCATLKP